MKELKNNRIFGFAVIAITYTVAAAVGIIIFQLLSRLEFSFWLSLFIADCYATVLVWLIGIVCDNASVYDPFWSVQPIVIALAMYFGGVYKDGAFITGNLLLLIVICLWGVRLTANWAYTFKGLGKQDWRYSDLKQKTGSWYFLVNLFGINFFPTAVVFCCMLPVAYLFKYGGIYSGYSAIGLAICVIAIALQFVSDCQLHIFKKHNTDKSKLIDIGLWKHGRHPNYLGEILMWWGVYAVLLSANPGLWYLFFGALINTLMFVFISIPMADKHLKNYKTGYEEYKKRTRTFI